jgi:predicted DNA binding CopG/RHH family protein
MKPPRIPQTDSIEELARFWDSHDLTDFEDELEEVTTPVFVRPTDQISIRLEPDELEAVEQIARAEGQELRSLIHDWVVEKLHQVSHSGSTREAEQR